jgi:TRAP-type C4-dicarboxylate transport system permease small subunit
MNCLTAVNARLSRWSMYIGVTCLLGIVATVLVSVILRYGFNKAPPWSEQVALLLIINVALFGAAAGIRDHGHIGMDSLTTFLSPQAQRLIGNINGVLTILFGMALVWGGILMAISVYPNKITVLTISESWRYVPCIVAGTFIISFSIEHLVAMFKGQEVVPSWH